MNYITPTTAAQIKNVSLATVNQAIESKRIHKTMIDGTPYILTNRAFENWKPGVKKLEEK